MDRPSAEEAAAGPKLPAFDAALWVLATQCLLALSWTLYVLFLPSMLASAGIERRWFVYVLLVDQLIFAACDWLAGAYADRIAFAHRRVGRAIAVVALGSSAALLSMPWIAGPGHALPLLIVIFVWAATSSALRAPVFALLGRIRESSEPRATRRHASIAGPGAIGIALVGISLAGAIGPFLTMAMQGVDARLPIAVSAIALAAAGWWATHVDAVLPAPAPSSAPSRQSRRRGWSLAAAVLIAGFGTQVVTAIVALPLFQRFVGGHASLWVAWFWVGFGLGLYPGNRLAFGSRTVAPARPPTAAAIALVVGALAFGLGANGGGLALLVVGVALAGAAWGVFATIAFTDAVSLSGGRATTGGAGTASGLLFSALAVGTLLRLGLVAAGWQRGTLVAWVPEIAWIAASLVLWIAARLFWRPRDAAVPAPA